MTVTIEPIELGNQRGLKKFLQFGINHYKGNPYYVPPLKAEMLGNKLFGVKGIMTAEHPFHKNAEVMHWLARKNGKPVGRIAAAIKENFNSYHKQKIGNFGFFESIQDEEVSGKLLNTAADWIKAKAWRPCEVRVTTQTQPMTTKDALLITFMITLSSRTYITIGIMRISSKPLAVKK